MPDSAAARDILHRWEGNPILTIDDVPFRANTVFNGTPLVREDGIDMLLRVEGQQGYSFFALARSRDGLHFTVCDKPVMMPAEVGPWALYESRGIEDPRATRLDGTYYVLYVASGPYGPRIALAKTDDHMSYERIALVSEPGNKDGVLFPRKIKGRYARLDRPIGEDKGCIWISYSLDLIHWGDSQMVLPPGGVRWDTFRVGASVPPIETPAGWLKIYHGTSWTPAGPVYRAGALLLDLDDPANVVKQGLVPLLSPRAEYERIGDIGNVCFACGAVVFDNGTIYVYYGAADTSICVATGTIDQIMTECLEYE
ncbi:MAG: glycoside hydrolase family 130 protein [Kiritimatiellae bacterium]|nr:glycoside hydrolase family 130 protein [Kiritimatiellia bacterium]